MSVTLSEQERIMLASLKRRRDQWPTLRRMMIALALVNFAIALSEFIASGWSPMPLIFLALATALATTIYRDWHGPAITTLLLRVLERDSVGDA